MNAAINGPPIVAGGLVWATDWNHATLYGLNPQTGQAIVHQSTPSMEHFTTPSASDGKLFLATGNTVEAYTIANPASIVGPAPPPPPAPALAPKCVFRLRSHRVKVHHPKRRKGHKHAPPAFATVGLGVKCDQTAQVTLTGTVFMHLTSKGRHGKAKTRSVRLTRMRTTVRTGVARTLDLRLTTSLLRALQRHIRENGSFTLTVQGAGGTARVRTHGRLRL